MFTSWLRYSYLVTGSTEQQRGDDLVSQQAGFSLHAGIACKAHQRKKLERLCRYIIRAALGRAALGWCLNSMALPNPFLALSAAAMALPAFAAVQPVETIVGIKATACKDCGSSSSSSN